MKIKISKAHINTILVISTIVLLSYLYITYQHELFKLTSIYEGMENEDDKNKKDKKDVKKPKIKLNTNRPQDIQKYVQDVMSDYINANIQVKGPAGPQGPRGPAGPEGKTGGNFSFAGFIRNVANPADSNNVSMVLDRTYGTGDNSKLYLNERNNLSNQMWKLNSDNTLSNQYGSCLSTSGKGDVYMENCDATNTKMQWSYNKDGQIVSQNTGTDCLSIGNINYDDKFTVNNNDGQWIGESDLKDKKVVSLQKCNLADLNQRWTFN